MTTAERSVTTIRQVLALKAGLSGENEFANIKFPSRFLSQRECVNILKTIFERLKEHSKSSVALNEDAVKVTMESQFSVGSQSGTDSILKEIGAFFAGRQNDIISHLVETLERLLRDENFGCCENEECKKAIGYERVKAVPNTHFCIVCKTKLEAEKTRH
ncbi:MAG: hypothetical protein Q7R98_01255 [Candidatus Jorgensenbacteria bacterium]|nr:hypothetical protein [Candidatus Jorgensenbacteria bacterium]